MKMDPTVKSFAMRSASGPPDSKPIVVLTPVGSIELTRIRWGASSLVRVCMIPTTPCLAAAYGRRNG